MPRPSAVSSFGHAKSRHARTVISFGRRRRATAHIGYQLILADRHSWPIVDTPPVPAASFSSPLLGKIYGAMWPRRYDRTGLSALTGELSGEEMSHLTTLLQKPESTANAPQALADYIRVIREEQAKRDASGLDPLLLAQETFKDKKRYGGKRT